MSHPYEDCCLCPHRCGADRSRGELGVCGEGTAMRIAFAGIHRGEEPPISVQGGQFRGSGTIFFSGCTLGCRDCQNLQISSQGSNLGRAVTYEEFASICLSLQERGAANINLVTGTQFIPSIIEGLVRAKTLGLDLPVVWNTSSYESAEGLKLLFPFVDIFLADLKAYDGDACRLFCRAGNYPAAAKESIIRMAAGNPLVFDGERLLGGVVFRHLVIPGALENTRRVMDWYAAHLQGKSLLSVMVQYMPIGDAPASDRAVTEDEYDELLDILSDAGIEEGFLQELEDESPWVPDFTRANPFPPEFCDPLWHYASGPIDVPS